MGGSFLWYPKNKLSTLNPTPNLVDLSYYPTLLNPNPRLDPNLNPFAKPIIFNTLNPVKIPYRNPKRL